MGKRVKIDGGESEVAAPAEGDAKVEVSAVAVPESKPAEEAAPQKEEGPKKYRVKVGRHINYNGAIHFFAAGQVVTSHSHDVEYLKLAKVEMEPIEG
jgi:hypothetical protein